MAARSDKPFGRLTWPGLALVLTGAYGVAGYMLIERWSFVDALYMTLLALTSVGFEEARPLSLAGEWFTISLLGLGVGIFRRYAVTNGGGDLRRGVRSANG